MNVFLLTDLEGLPGVTSIDFIDQTRPEYAQACKLLADTINRTAEICRRSGAEEIYYLDGHAGGGNVDEALVRPDVHKTDLAGWEKLLADGKIDCQMEVGTHARAGTMGGFLDHTISSRTWFCHRINGMESSELSLHAAVCGQYGVPVVACIGDAVACNQAKEYIPGISCAVVKRAKCRNFCTEAPDAMQQIEQAVTAALANYRQIPPYQMKQPLTVELTFYRTDFCEAAFARCQAAGIAVERMDARTLRRTVERLTSYADLKLG